MMKVQIKRRAIVVDGKPIPLISGEVHYWRLDPHQWEAILEKVKGLGLEMVSTYVPWDFHEVSPREYDFIGRTDPRRNLRAYLELLEKKGFWILIRPGPYIYSEWKNLGVPDRVMAYHRSHPKFVQEARHYLEAVFKVIRLHLVTQGGRILLVQPDNELDPMLYAYEDQLGLVGGSGPPRRDESRPGPFQDFLKGKYRRIQGLNRAWATRYESFDQAKPAADLIFHGTGAWIRFLDFKEFIYWHVTQMGQLWCHEYLRLGCDVPLYLNLYPFYEIQPWKVLSRCADFSALDIYPTQEFHGEPEEHQDFLQKVRALRSQSPVPFIAEFQSGTWHGYHTRSGIYSPNHYRLSALSALLGGATGWSWYMLVNRDNWYLCPIDEWGQVRHELYDVFHELVRVFKEIQPHQLEKVTDVGVSFYPMHFTTRAISKDNPLLKSLYQADMDYEFVDFEEGISKKKLVFYLGASWCPKAHQKNLLKYVEQGGILVSFLQFPHLDEHLKPLNLLGFTVPSSILGEREGIGCEKILEIVLNRQIFEVKSPFYLFEDVRRPIEARVKENLSCVGQWSLLKGRKYKVGYIQKKGKGLLVQVGTGPTPDLILGLLDFLNVPPLCHSTTPGVQTAAYSPSVGGVGSKQRKPSYYVFVVNSSQESKNAHIQLACTTRPRKAIDLFSKRELSFYPFEKGFGVDVPLERKSGTALAVHL